MVIFLFNAFLVMEREYSWDLGESKKERIRNAGIKERSRKIDFKWLLAWAKGEAWAKTHLNEKRSSERRRQHHWSVKCEITTTL